MGNGDIVVNRRIFSIFGWDVLQGGRPAKYPTKTNRTIDDKAAWVMLDPIGFTACCHENKTICPRHSVRSPLFYIFPEDLSEGREPISLTVP